MIHSIYIDQLAKRFASRVAKEQAGHTYTKTILRLSTGAKIAAFLLLLLPAWADAQRIAYFDEFMNEVDVQSNFRFFAEITPLPEGGFYAKRFRADSTLVEEGAFSTYEKGKRMPEGLHKNYRPSGELWFTVQYKNGIRSGELRSYYPSGALKRIQHYADNRPIGGECFAEDGAPLPFTPFEAPPQYPGGNEAMNRFLTEHMKYPAIARENGVTGRVLVTFTVGKDGLLKDLRLLEDIGQGCGEEALRVLSLMGPWTPGKLDDEVAQVRFTLPMTFSLEGARRKNRRN